MCTDNNFGFGHLGIFSSHFRALVWPLFVSVNFTPEVVPGANEFPPGGNLSMKHGMKDRLLQGVLLLPGACVALLAGPRGQHSCCGTGAAGLQVSLLLSGADLKCESFKDSVREVLPVQF